MIRSSEPASPSRRAAGEASEEARRPNHRRVARSATKAASSALAVAVLAVAAGAAPLVVRFDGVKLWVSCQSLPASQLFKALAEKTGVRFALDADIKNGAVTLDLQGLPLERAVRAIAAAVPEAAGHTMSYARQENGEARLTAVSIYGAGKAPAGGGPAVFAAAGNTPIPFPTPDLQERLDQMIAAGVPRETAEKVVALTQEVQKLQATPEPGSYRAEDLSPASREQLQPLLDRGVPIERAVQMLLLQEKYQDTLKDLSAIQGSPAVTIPGVPAIPGQPRPEPRGDE